MKKHKHKWSFDGDRCPSCGVAQAICTGCDTIALFDEKGKLLETMKIKKSK